MISADSKPEELLYSGRLEPIAMRLEVKEGKNNCVLINDSYNSDLASLDIALDFLVRRSEKKGLKRTLILSDILETGQSTATLYRRVAQRKPLPCRSLSFRDDEASHDNDSGSPPLHRDLLPESFHALSVPVLRTADQS